MFKKDTYVKGALMSVFGGIFWALSGNFGQYLFTQRGFDSEWLTTVRLLSAGVIMLAICAIKDGKSFLNILKSWRDIRDLIIYGIIGMAGVQLTFFAAIEFSNAPTGTLLQYSGSSFIIIYVALKMRKLPAVNEILAVLLAMAGIFLLSTHGHINALAISEKALAWGLTSALLMAFYSIFPKRMLDKWGTLATNGWGMLIGGIAMAFKRSPMDLGGGTLDINALLAVAGVVVLGTVLSFFCYLEGVRIIGSDKAVLYACVEPLTSAIIVMVWFHVPFGLLDWMGAILIVGEVFMISGGKKAESDEKQITEENVQNDT